MSCLLQVITNLNFLVTNTKRQKVWISHAKNKKQTNKKVPLEGFLEETNSEAGYPGDTGSLNGGHVWTVSFLLEKSIHVNMLET